MNEVTDGTRAAPAQRRLRGGWVRATAAALVVFLAAGCGDGGGDADEDDGGATSAPTAPATGTASPSDVAGADTFAYEWPEPPCPPVEELAALPLGDEGTYQVDPRFEERDDSLKAWCTYQLAALTDQEEDPVLADHVLVTAELALYRSWADSAWSDAYPPVPVGSDDPADWAAVVESSTDQGVWWEGCGRDGDRGTSCRDGDDPTVRTHAWETSITGHVGNLELYVHVVQVAEEPPSEPESVAVPVFRDLVGAVTGHLAPAGD